MTVHHDALRSSVAGVLHGVKPPSLCTMCPPLLGANAATPLLPMRRNVSDVPTVTTTSIDQNPAPPAVNQLHRSKRRVASPGEGCSCRELGITAGHTTIARRLLLRPLHCQSTIWLVPYRCARFDNVCTAELSPPEPSPPPPPVPVASPPMRALRTACSERRTPSYSTRT